MLKTLTMEVLMFHHNEGETKYPWYVFDCIFLKIIQYDKVSDARESFINFNIETDNLFNILKYKIDIKTLNYLLENNNDRKKLFNEMLFAFQVMFFHENEAYSWWKINKYPISILNWWSKNLSINEIWPYYFSLYEVMENKTDPEWSSVHSRFEPSPLFDIAAKSIKLNNISTENLPKIIKEMVKNSNSDIVSMYSCKICKANEYFASTCEIET